MDIKEPNAAQAPMLEPYAHHPDQLERHIHGTPFNAGPKQPPAIGNGQEFRSTKRRKFLF